MARARSELPALLGRSLNDPRQRHSVQIFDQIAQAIAPFQERLARFNRNSDFRIRLQTSRVSTRAGL